MHLYLFLVLFLTVPIDIVWARSISIDDVGDIEKLLSKELGSSDIFDVDDRDSLSKKLVGEHAPEDIVQFLVSNKMKNLLSRRKKENEDKFLEERFQFSNIRSKARQTKSEDKVDGPKEDMGPTGEANVPEDIVEFLVPNRLKHSWSGYKEKDESEWDTKDIKIPEMSSKPEEPEDKIQISEESMETMQPSKGIPGLKILKKSIPRHEEESKGESEQNTHTKNSMETMIPTKGLKIAGGLLEKFILKGLKYLFTEQGEEGKDGSEQNKFDFLNIFSKAGQNKTQDDRTHPIKDLMKSIITGKGIAGLEIAEDFLKKIMLKELKHFLTGEKEEGENEPEQSKFNFLNIFSNAEQKENQDDSTHSMKDLIKSIIPGEGTPGLEIAGDFLKKLLLKELKHLLTGQKDESEDESEQDKFHSLNIFSKAEHNETQDDSTHPIKDLIKSIIPGGGLEIGGEFLKKLILKEVKNLLTGQKGGSEDESEQNKFHFLNIFSKAEQNQDQDDNTHPIRDLIKTAMPTKGLEIAGEFLEKLILKELKHLLPGQEDENENDSEQNKFHFLNIFSKAEKNDNKDDSTHPIKDLMKTAIPAKGLKIAGEFLKKFFLKELKHLLTGQDESEDGSEQNKFHFLNIFSKAEQNDTQDDNSHPIKDLIKSIIPGEGLEIAGEFFKKLILKELKHSLTGQEDQNEDESEQNKFHFPNIFSNTEQNENQDDNTHPIKDLMKTVISTKGLKIGGYFLEKLILKELKHFLSGQDEESDDDSEQNKSNIFNIFSKGDKNETQDDTTHPIKDLVESLIPKEGLKTAGYFLEKFLLKELKHLLTGQEDKSENDSEQNKFNKFNIFSKGETNETQDDTTHPIKEFLKLIISKKGLKVAEYFFKKFILSHPIKELMELISAKKLKTVGDYLGKFILKELKHFLSGKRGDNVHAKQYDGEENIHLVELIEPTRASGNFYHGSADEIESSKAMRDIQELLDEKFGPARDNWNSMRQTEENEYYQNDDNNHALLDLTKSPIVLSVLDNAFGWLFDNNNGNTKDAIIKKVVEVASKFLGNDDNNSESDSDNHDMRDSIIKKVVEMAFNFFSNEANSEPVGQPSAFETQPAGCTDCIDSSYDAIYGGAGVGYEAGEDSPYYVYN